MLTTLMMTLLLQAFFRSPSGTAGEGWQFVMAEVNKSPRWRPTSDAPPLTSRAAVRASRSLLHRMSCKDAETWELAEVALRPVGSERDVWVYVVKFQEQYASRQAPSGRFPRVVEIPVMLDGTAEIPSVGPWPPRK
jgi:hypothetical protein